MAQVRFRPGQCLADNFYMRGDKTLVYFFTEGREILTSQTAIQSHVTAIPSTTDEVAMRLEEAGLVKELVHTDHRLQVNRGRQLKMYRVWIQAQYSYPTDNRTKKDS